MNSMSDFQQSTSSIQGQDLQTSKAWKRFASRFRDAFRLAKNNNKTLPRPSPQQNDPQIDSAPPILSSSQEPQEELIPSGLWRHKVANDLTVESVRTHDSSSTVYHTQWPTWAQDLNEALAAGSNRTFQRYSQVSVLLLSWEEDNSPDPDKPNLGQRELKRLHGVFEEFYGYPTEQWFIPSSDHADDMLNDKLRDFVQGQDNLVIVYYSGHGTKATDPGGPPIWHSRDDEKGKWEINTLSIYHTLAKAKDDSPDVLLLFDCCHSLYSRLPNRNHTRAVVECLFAGGFESKVPTAGHDSFTSALIHCLSNAARASKPFQVGELHGKLINFLQNDESALIFDGNDDFKRDRNNRPRFKDSVRKTPLHSFLSHNRRPITLTPIGSSSSLSPSPSSNTSDGNDTNSELHAMLSVRLEGGEETVRDFREWCSVAPKKVRVMGFHPSKSFVLLVAIPIHIWDLLPASPAVSFVDYISEPISQWETQKSHDILQEYRNLNVTNPVVMRSFLDIVDQHLPKSLPQWQESLTSFNQLFDSAKKHYKKKYPEKFDSYESEIESHRNFTIRYLEHRALVALSPPWLCIADRSRKPRGNPKLRGSTRSVINTVNRDSAQPDITPASIHRGTEDSGRSAASSNQSFRAMKDAAAKRLTKIKVYVARSPSLSPLRMQVTTPQSLKAKKTAIWVRILGITSSNHEHQTSHQQSTPNDYDTRTQYGSGEVGAEGEQTLDDNGLPLRASAPPVLA